MGYIYIIKNKINDRVYIGQTRVNIKTRFNNHLSSARKGGHYAIYKAMRKYGLNNFWVEELEKCPNPQLNEREQYWIAQYQSNQRKHGYNMSEGGGYNANDKGDRVYLYDINGNYLRYFQNQRTCSEQLKCTQTAVSFAIRHKSLFLGQYQIRKTKENYLQNIESIKHPVKQFDKNGKFIARYESFMEAHRQTGASWSGISLCCKHKSKTSGGFQWRFENDNTPVKRVYKQHKHYWSEKKIYQYDLEGNLIRIHRSLALASKHTGITMIRIVTCCKDQILQCDGYIFRYEGSNLPVKLRKYKFKKEIIQKDSNGKEIARFPSIAAAGKSNNVSSSLVGQIARGLKPNYKRFFFEYAS